MQSGDQMYGYTTILLASAPMASQLSMAQLKWTIFFPIFAIPAITLLISVGHLSRRAPVQTFRKIAPIGAGIGWALTWHIAEKLYTESLRASQILIYFINSLRPTLSWALECEHSYNSKFCQPFNDPNVSKSILYPNNFWPAQEFNRFRIRQNALPESMPAKWEPNMWYLGDSKEEFYFAIPSIPLFLSHILTWTTIYFILVKFYDRLGEILTKIFVFIPVMLYLAVVMGMTVSGLHFTNGTMEVSLDDKKISEDLFDFWADLKGGFRTSILIVDYSMAFTGIVIFATSRLRTGVGYLNALFVVPSMMIVPMIQTILRAGCEGHISDLQPSYKIFASTDETISFDLLPVCFATSNLGPIWSALYFFAQYFYTSLGPMIVYTAFIYQSFIDDIPTVQNYPKRFIGLLCLAFTVPAIFLYMPLGTKVAALFRYTSQSAIIQILAFVIIFFIYGWQRIEQDVLMTSPTAVSPGLTDYLIRPTSPIYTTALFTVIPMLICAKFVAVFDFLPSGNDVMKHIDAGVQFIPLPHWAARLQSIQLLIYHIDTNFHFLIFFDQLLIGCT
ncbi:unnamed protein product [Caenorhabditis angaria]|uniref:Uncharacterized protein n=1 Tax=Caenorhabditis angaria TaxID=860376 RepID=A0A9P1IC15_9PELO|nr:unnamed protein product [Caenorhabditis angaria]